MDGTEANGDSNGGGDGGCTRVQPYGEADVYKPEGYDDGLTGCVGMLPGASAEYEAKRRKDTRKVKMRVA